MQKIIKVMQFSNGIGADKRGTGKKPFKQVVSNSKENGGFYIDVLQDKNKGIQQMVFTESPIDALSYYDSHRTIQQTRIASLSGLKDSSLQEHIKQASLYNISNLGIERSHNPLNSLVIAVDNDEAGKNFVYNTLNKYENDFKIDLPETAKDWNEQLKKDKAMNNGIKIYSNEDEKNIKLITNQHELEM